VTETEVLNQLTDFAKKDETWYERYATGGHLNDVRSDVLLSVTPWQSREPLRWKWQLMVMDFRKLCNLVVVISFYYFAECNIATWQQCDKFLCLSVGYR
jgi:hypothetical protein